MPNDGSNARDGAQCAADPTVGCPHDTTVRPPGGAGARGTMTIPVTTTGSPFRSVERYMMRHARLATGSPHSCSDLMSVPGSPSAAPGGCV